MALIKANDDEDFPFHMEIGPYPYEVVTDEATCAKANVGQQNQNWGRHQGDEQRIYVAPETRRPHKATILFHETLHAVLWAYEIRVPDDGEEELVRQLAPALVSLFKHNPKLVRYLAES